MEENMPELLISIVMPVYNVEKYIRNCLTSVINQDFADYEVILVDDGSTDSSGSICDEYAAKYNHIRVIHKPNEGAYQARLDGARIAIGEYLWFVDSDDEIMAGSLNVLSMAIEQNNRPDMLIFNYCKNRDALSAASSILPTGLYSGREIRKLTEVLCKSEVINAVWQKCFKQELIINNEDLSDIVCFSFAEDIFMSASAINKTDTCFVMREVLYSYRLNTESTTQKYNRQKIEGEKKSTTYLSQLAKEWEKKYGLKLDGYIGRKMTKGCIGEFRILLESDLSWSDKRLEVERLLSDDFFRAAVYNSQFIPENWWERYLHDGFMKSKNVYKFSKNYIWICKVKNFIKRICNIKT